MSKQDMILDAAGRFNTITLWYDRTGRLPNTSELTALLTFFQMPIPSRQTLYRDIIKYCTKKGIPVPKLRETKQVEEVKLLDSGGEKVPQEDPKAAYRINTDEILGRRG